MMKFLALAAFFAALGFAAIGAFAIENWVPIAVVIVVLAIARTKPEPVAEGEPCGED
jgi:hypothetical protein